MIFVKYLGAKISTGSNTIKAKLRFPITFNLLKKSVIADLFYGFKRFLNSVVFFKKK